MKEKHKKKRNALLFLILSVCIISGLISFRNQYDSYPISDGFLDLSEENMEGKVIRLNGIWRFYEGTFEDNGPLPYGSLEVPGTWRGKVINGKKMDQHDIGVYELRLRVPSPGDYCMKLNYISSAYELYINDTKILENGRTGTDKMTEIPSWTPQFIYFHADHKDIVIKLKVSNFHCNNGGIVLPLYFGRQAPLFRFHLLNLVKNIGFIGILTGMACYLYVFNWCLNKKAQSVYLWIFCVSVLVASSIIDGESLVSVLSFLTINAVLKIEYVSFMVQITAIQFFLWSMYPELGRTHPVRFLIVMDFFYTAILLCLPVMPVLYENVVFIPVLFINALNYFLLIAKAFRLKKPNAGPIFLGYCTLIASCILQIVDIQYNIDIKYLGDINFYYFGVLFFLLCQGYVLAVNVEDTYRQSELAHEMEIASLQAQISPHFLFNILHNIYSLMDTNGKMAKKLLMCLSDFLRVKYRFDYRTYTLYQLREELDLVNAYVQLENVRMNDALKLVIDAPDELLSNDILPLTLQPLVENSIKHGYDSGELNIMVTIRQAGDRLVISVEDDGRGIRPEVLESISRIDAGKSGVGLNNINYRLKICFGSRLEIQSLWLKGTKISFQIPKRG
ncbi:sensor histidine kinase [Lacrimispora saccharolytica]|uniref:Signal transduction histidine kinase, LytS n=1 Tax=Lacrimispora saccharolytica (strain ATCC 35040 / DSM 2544 / NRCC 2533 / WM1) TaxID=610130 RepID=D9R9K5_LACSW|nr:histidine kinase [Lacrimispora saccharolytica]ADL04055.1 signal transduction histidine kinase, LytS [[Clostridium] saccharolyticum WM1]QRV21647.1 histidine kinase [Lacrimispora saccharolytica]